MSKWKIKTIVEKQENIYPDDFNSKVEAEEFLKTKMPAAIIPSLIEDGIIKIYKESTLLDSQGQPLEVTDG